MKKIIVPIAIGISIVLAVTFFKIREGIDRNPPQITFDNDEAIYEEGMTEEELLEGVSAEDDVDGDVSDSIKIEKIYKDVDGNKVGVVYVAKDTGNNVTKRCRTFKIQPKN